MNWILAHAPLSFILGAIGGPIFMALFQLLKKAAVVDSLAPWQKRAAVFVVAQVVTIGTAWTGQNITCATDAQSIMDCVNQLTPEVIKGIVLGGGALLSHYLKKLPATPTS